MALGDPFAYQRFDRSPRPEQFPQGETGAYKLWGWTCDKFHIPAPNISENWLAFAYWLAGVRCATKGETDITMLAIGRYADEQAYKIGGNVPLSMQ